MCVVHWLRALGAALAAIALGGCDADEDGDASAAPTAGAGGDGVGGGGGAGGGAGAPSGPVAGAVRRYEYAFDLTTGEGDATLRVMVDPPGGDCFAVACNAAVTDISWNEMPAASAKLDEGALELCGSAVGPGELTVGAHVAVGKQTFLGLDVGFSEKVNTAGGTFSYLLSWVGGCDHFGPCDDAPPRLSEFAFDVTHPAGTTVLCPGKLTAGETATHCELAGTLAPTYSAFSIAGDTHWKRTPFATAKGAAPGGDLSIVFYEPPGAAVARALDPARVVAFVDWVTKLLGPFPYGDELRVGVAPTKWAGFEHPASILLSEDVVSFKGSYLDPAMHVLAHEIAHQWAGDRVTLASALDFVWKEATVEYLAYVFEDETGAPGEAQATVSYWYGIALGAKHHPRPTDAPPPPVEKFYGDVYGAGPLVLYLQLESLLGRDVVLAAIQDFLAEAGARSVEDLRDALEKASGKDLDAYVDAWVFGSGAPAWPTLAAEVAQAAGQATVTVTQAGKPRGMLVEVEIAGATTAKTVAVDFGVAPAEAKAQATVAFAEPVTKLTVNPRKRVLAKAMGVAPAPAPPFVWML
jgi:aminopeptidase N